MKRLAVLLTAMIIVGTSLANTKQNGNALYGNPTTIGLLAKTATKNGPGLVKSTRIPKPKLFRANPHRLSYFALIDDQDDIGISDDDLATSYRRRDLSKIESPKDDSEGLSEEIRWRLFLARQLALLKYREIHG